jgi:ribosomal protein S18 acetylase RimI-like enzyme
VSAMSAVPFSPVGRANQAKAMATLVLAFAADPVERWLYPQPQEYVRHFPDFLAAFGGGAFAQETVWQSADCCAVALWLPPGTEPDAEAIVALLTDTVAAEKHADMLAVLDQMTAAHPTHPHWYLPWFGVDPAVQGQRLGTRLLTSCLEFVDASHSPAYLETPNPRTIPFYQRHGFETAGDAAAGTCPPITFMLRPAR